MKERRMRESRAQNHASIRHFVLALLAQKPFFFVQKSYANEQKLTHDVTHDVTDDQSVNNTQKKNN